MPGTVSDRARRLTPLVHILDALSRSSAGRLVREPRLHRKVALAEHARDDALASAELRELLDALGHRPGEPHDELRDILERLDAAETPADHAAAAAEVKQLAAEVAQVAEADVDPLLEEGTLRVLIAVRTAQERHVADLLPAVDAGPFDEAASPADPAAAGLHALLHAEIAAGERAAQAHHATGEPAHAAGAHKHLRHAAVVDRELTRLGAPYSGAPGGEAGTDPNALAERWNADHGAEHPEVAAVLAFLLTDR
jgi:hypothetical protein